MLIAGTELLMEYPGTVTGTADSLALARGLVHAEHHIAPAIAQLDELLLDPAISADDDAVEKLEEQKQKIIDNWNATIAPWLLDDCTAIIDHIIAGLHVRIAITPFDGGLQRSTASGDPTDPPDAEQELFGDVINDY